MTEPHQPAAPEDEAPAPDAPARPWLARHGALLATLLLLLTPVWIVDPLPLQDLPLHEHVVALLLHGLDWSGDASRLAVDWTPRPYAVLYPVWASLAWVVGIDVASRLLISYAVGGGLIAGVHLVRRLDPRKETRALLLALVVFSDFYFVGFIPLLLALPTGLWLLARRLPEPLPSERALGRGAVDALLLLITFLCHPLAGFLVGLVLIAPCARSERPLPALAQLVAIGAPCVVWHLAIALLGADRALNPNLPLSWVAPWQNLLSLLCYPTGPYGWFLFWPLGGPARVLALLSIVAWGLAAAALWPSGERADRPAIPGLGWSLLTVIAFLFLFPDAWRNGSALSQRALLLFFPLFLAWLPARAETARARALTLAAVLLACGVGFAAHVIVSNEAKPLDAVLAQLEPGENVLAPLPAPHSRAVRGRLADPHLNAFVRHVARRGGLGPTGALLLSTTPTYLREPLPQVADPRLYRYIVLPRGALKEVPRGFAEHPSSTPAWQVFEAIR